MDGISPARSRLGSPGTPYSPASAASPSFNQAVSSPVGPATTALYNGMLGVLDRLSREAGQGSEAKNAEWRKLFDMQQTLADQDMATTELRRRNTELEAAAAVQRRELAKLSSATKDQQDEQIDQIISLTESTRTLQSRLQAEKEAAHRAQLEQAQQQSASGGGTA